MQIRLDNRVWFAFRTVNSPYSCALKFAFQFLKYSSKLLLVRILGFELLNPLLGGF